MVSKVPCEAEGLPAQVTHVALLTVDSHVVAEGHVVGVGLAAEVTPELGRTGRKEVVNRDRSLSEPCVLLTNILATF